MITSTYRARRASTADGVVFLERADETGNWEPVGTLHGSRVTDADVLHRVTALLAEYAYVYECIRCGQTAHADVHSQSPRDLREAGAEAGFVLVARALTDTPSRRTAMEWACAPFCLKKGR